MAILKIARMGHPVLARRADEVSDPAAPEIRRLVADMVETMIDANGAGLGYVDIYDTNGKLIKQLVAAGGALNAPWGLALAPSDFGTLSGALLVGNFGDGNINAYDAAAGTLIGTVKDSTGKALAAPGLWGIAFGNDAKNQPHNTLFFAAGPNNEANGSYGRIDVGATPPVPQAKITLRPRDPLMMQLIPR